MIHRKYWLFLTYTDDVMGLAKLVRQDLHLVLSQALLGDHLAADYFICHLISAV
jgi:hypothetical protein